MNEIKIKNLTVTIDGQDYAFTHKSVVPLQEYDSAQDPEVQGKGLNEISAGVPGHPNPKVEPLKAKKRKKV